ncbi:hypothetical protein Baya_2938 [Bagarius yarrelli]|uniref:A-kinase-interacting protein 1 n=1 Tax=Bagarius yarrelli TaxID=175774 RepID=A0A556TQY0_BAGYA|nr:hypothetical protein Baya_2938 [Bagarius yarrelli]
MKHFLDTQISSPSVNLATVKSAEILMAGRCWLESSLDRSSKLGLEVLQRAKRRSERWKSGRTSRQDDSDTEKHSEDLSEPEDFLVEVSPGTYAITAAMPDAGPQTRVVHINAGESMRLTFNL